MDRGSYEKLSEEIATAKILMNREIDRNVRNQLKNAEPVSSFYAGRAEGLREAKRILKMAERCAKPMLTNKEIEARRFYEDWTNTDRTLNFLANL
tara:strand:+ start:342 stop:626 length:285 start_codon:yes stop_codon:yes gene_type:complete